MVELHVLTGRQAGGVFSLERFPSRVGRAPTADVCLDDPGVWEQHLEIEVRGTDGVHVRRQPPALTSLNGTPFEETLLRNGDVLELGSARLRFWLRPPVQQTFLLRETLTWTALALLCLLQAGLILWLTH